MTTFTSIWLLQGVGIFALVKYVPYVPGDKTLAQVQFVPSVRSKIYPAFRVIITLKMPNNPA